MTMTEETALSMKAGIFSRSARAYTSRKRKAPSTAPKARSGMLRCLPKKTPPISREASATVTMPLPMFTS